MSKRFLGYRDMTAKVGVSRTQIQRWVADGTLPKPMRLDTHRRASRFLVEKIAYGVHINRAAFAMGKCKAQAKGELS
jgi:predicted DNA-binding transcriptional regulator AlpA